MVEAPGPFSLSYQITCVFWMRLVFLEDIYAFYFSHLGHFILPFLFLSLAS